MDRTTLAREIYRVSIIKGNFTLRSGIQTLEYFDKYLFEARPDLLLEIANQLAPSIPENIDALAGLEMGGIAIATALSLQTGVALVFVRKEAKAYGTCKLAEGETVAGKKLLIIEDVVTSGGAVVKAVNQLRNLGAEIDRALCVIDRESTGRKNLRNIGIELNPLFTKSYLEST